MMVVGRITAQENTNVNITQVNKAVEQLEERIERLNGKENPSDWETELAELLEAALEALQEVVDHYENKG
jgi:chaperonin cofactor prefoldin